MEFSELIENSQEKDLRDLCIVNGIVAYLTQNTIDKIINIFPTFFDKIELHVIDSDTEKFWLKKCADDYMEFHKVPFLERLF